MRAASALALALVAVAPAAEAQQPPLEELLDKAARYVRGFEQTFATVISDELTTQREHLTRRDRGITKVAESRRTIRSETMFMFAGEERSWITVRNVLQVDNRAVADSRQRLDRLLTETPSGAIADRLRRLRDESTRFNLGGIQRNSSDPMLPFQFLDPTYQPRFQFTLDGPDAVAGVPAWKVAFAERVFPTVVTVDGNPQPASGAIWLTSSGIVLRTSLRLANTLTNLSAEVDVTYAQDRKIGGWVPSRMNEVFNQAPRDTGAENTITDLVTCVSVYSNFRRFETTTRLLTPK